MRDPPFVGRRAEVAELIGLLDRLTDGRPGVILLSGEAGVGKTRLLREVNRSAADRGITVLTGAGVPLGAESLPYAPFVEALREHLEAASPAPPRPVSEAGLSARAYQFERFLETLRGLARREPVLLVLEDLHWADRTTLELLVFLTRTIRTDRVGLAASWRTDGLRRDHPLRQVVAELSRADNVDRLDLAPFELEETAQLLEAVGGGSVPDELSRSIHERAQGNPFIAQELLAAAGGEHGPGLPPTLRDALLARTVGLSETSRRLLRVCTVIPGRLDHDLLLAAAQVSGGLSEGEVQEAVEEVVDAGLILPDDGGYRFRHHLVSQALYDDLLPFERARLHSAVADAVEVLPAPVWDWRRPAELAAHRLAANELEAALKAFVAAGEAASEVGAFDEARQQLETALGLWDGAGHPEELVELERGDLLLKAAEAANLAGDPLRAVTLAEAALRAVDADDTRRAGLLHMWLGRFLWAAGRGVEALAAHEQAVRLIPRDPSPERAYVLGAHAHALLHAGRFNDARARAEGAITIAQQTGSVEEEGRSRRTLGVALVESGDIEAGLREIEAGRDMAARAGCSDDELDAYEALGDALDRAARLEEAVAVLADGAAIARERGLSRVHAAKLLARQAHSLMRLGRWGQAARILDEADQLEPVGAVALLVALNRALLGLDRGELDSAESQLDRAEQLVRFGVVAAHEKAKLAVHRATLHLWRGQLDEAIAVIESGLEEVAGTDDRRHRAQLCVLGLAVEADRAERARMLGEGEALERSRSAGRRYMAELRRVGSDTKPVGLVELRTGEVHLARLHGEDRIEDWIGLAEQWGGLSEPWPDAHSRLYAARAAVSAGQDSVAREQLRRARELARELPESAPLVAGIEGLARSLRIDLRGDPGPPPDEPPPDVGLTPRELEVLALLCQGHTNAEIGERLFISPKTASVHVSNIMQKLGVKRRAEAATIALRLGLLAAAGGAREPGGR